MENNPLGTEPVENDKPNIEIDENKVVDNEKGMIWMFGLIGLVDKQTIIFCVMNDLTPDTLFEI